MFSNIPHQRLILYALIIGLLPILLVLLNIYSQQSDISSLKQNINYLQEMIITRETKQAANLAIKDQYKNADHFYIDKQIESIRLLKPEIESLKKIASQNNVVDNEAVKKRLEYLLNGNKIVFTEGVVQNTPFFQETIETLVHPIEVNQDNLQEILSKIEGIKIGSYDPGAERPQMIVIDLKLDKKRIEEKNEVFLLNLKLLKREFS